MNMTTEICHHQLFGCYTLKDGIFSLYFYITVYSRPINFSLLTIFCSSINVLLAYKLYWELDREGLKLIPSLINVILRSKNENRLYFRLKAYSIRLICMQKLLRLANNCFLITFDQLILTFNDKNAFIS